MSEKGQDAHVNFEYPRSRTGVRLAVIADPHVSPTHSGTWKVLHRTEQHLTAALRAAERLAVDAVLMPGDLTGGGTPEAFDAVDTLVSATSPPVLAVPGNHDSSSLPVMDDHSRNWVAGPSATPFRHTVGDVDVLGLNSVPAATGTDGGYVPDEQLQWLTDALDSADRPVVLTHYPLGIDWTGLDTVFPPEKRLEAPNYRLIEAGIATLPDMETLRECVAYENAHQNRTQILRRLQWKAEELRESEE